MSSPESFTVLWQIRRLQDELAALEEDWTVGNYFERVDIINQKRAKLATLQGV